MTVRRIVPNVFDADSEASRAFYSEVFELDVAMDMGWVTTLASEATAHPQISLFETDAGRGPNPFISIEVDDVDVVHERVRKRGSEVVYALRDEEWGVRRFMVHDPGGRVVNVLSHRSRASC